MVLPGLRAGTVGLLYGGGGGGKSFFALHVAVAVAAAAHNLFGLWQIAASGPAILIALEDDAEELHRRIYAIARMESIPSDRLHLFPVPALRPRLVERDRNGPVQWNRKAIIELLDVCRAVQPRLLVLDPLIRAHSLDENANSDMVHIMDLFSGIARAVEAAVLIVHHATKASRAGSTGDSAVARGAGVLTDEARWAAEVTPLSDREAQDIPEAERWRYLAVRVTKCNYGPRPEPLYLYRTEGGALVRALRLANPSPRRPSRVVPLAGRPQPLEEETDDVQDDDR